MIHHNPLNQLALSESMYRYVWGGKCYPIWKNKEEKATFLIYPA